MSGLPEPLRVLQVVTTLNRGGLETMLMNHYRALDRSRVQFDFLVHREAPGAYEAEVLALGGRIHRVPALALRNLLRYRQAVDAFFAGHPEYRIVHAHLDAMSTLVLRSARRAAVPVRIAHAHSTSLKRDAKRAGRFLSRLFLNGACTRRFACSEAAGDWLFGLEVRRRGELTVFRNAIDTPACAFSSGTRARLRRDLGIPEGARVLGHVGRFDHAKNQDFLLELLLALRRSEPEAVLLLAGDGPLRPAAERRAGELGLGDAVRFLGVRDDVPGLLQAMDHFLLPSRFEGLPVTAIEAQAAGLPCLLSDAITRDCDLTGNVRFRALAEGPSAWAEALVESGPPTRLPEAERRVAEAGYDVTANAAWLEAFYLDAWKGLPEAAP